LSATRSRQVARASVAIIIGLFDVTAAHIAWKPKALLIPAHRGQVELIDVPDFRCAVDQTNHRSEMAILEACRHRSRSPSLIPMATASVRLRAANFVSRELT
jgi:hypothetical protein